MLSISSRALLRRAGLHGVTGASASKAPAARRHLAIHEYLSAEILSKYGVGVPKGGPARSGAEAAKVAESLKSDDVVVKAQVLAGGRGKGTFSNGYKGGVHIVYSPEEAGQIAEKMIGNTLITKQTGAAGKPCNVVYIVERKFARREYYFAILMNRATQTPMIVGSSQGGMDIETVAKENPGAIVSVDIDVETGLTEKIVDRVIAGMDFPPRVHDQARKAIENLYRVFKETDATQVEINPLTETVENEVLAVDAKLNFDDNAEFRQQEIFSLRDKTQEDADEVAAGEFGLNFIKLDGSIGCLVNGAGLAMATMDIIKLNGGEPANFLDVGGSANAKAIKEAFTLITKDSKVTAIFVNIFGGIVRCDHIAKGLIDVVQELNLRIPIICRLQGTKQEAAQELVNASGLKIFSFSDLDEAALRAVKFSNIVRLARDIDTSVQFELPL